ARLHLERLELLELSLPCLVDQALFDVRRKLDRVDAEVSLLVDLDCGVARCARHLLIGGKERVLEGLDERAALDSLLALSVAAGLDDFLAHFSPIPSIRFPRTIAS